MRAGISSYTYTWAIGVPGSMPEKPMSVYDLVDKAAKNGISLIQVADNMPLEKLPGSDLVEIYNYARGKGVELEMGGRGLTPEHTIKCLDTAEILHSPILRMVIDSEDFKPGRDEIISILSDLSTEFKSRKIKLAIENHDRLKASDFAFIIEKSGPDFAGICLDTVNSLGAGEGFEHVCKILLPFTINLHVKDYLIFRPSHRMGFTVEGRPAGSGMLDIPWLIETLTASGKCQSAILELWTPPEKSIGETIKKEDEWAIKSIKYIRSVVNSC